MSNTQAIAAVTKTLCAEITAALSGITDAVAVPARPDDADIPLEADRVRIFLYRVASNAAWSNCDLPTRRSGGELAQRPRAALNLSYLLSFFGDQQQLIPELMLARAVLRLHERPLLTRAMIQAATTGTDPLDDVDLGDQPELVRLTPLWLNLEDLSKLWSVFVQTPYRLSVAYEASVVLIEDDFTPTRPLPVRERRIFAMPFRRPFITRIANAEDPLKPITAGARIEIQGRQLRGEITQVRLIGKERIPEPATGTDPEAGKARTREWLSPEWAAPPSAPDILRDKIQFALPEGFLAGLVSAQVLHTMTMGEPPAARPTASSNLAPLLLQPSIQQEAGDFLISVVDPDCDDVPDTDPVQQICSGSLAITIAPELATSQQIRVLLNRIQPPDEEGEPPVAHIIAGTPGEEAAMLNAPFTGVRDGSYLVRVQIDGVDSPLLVDDATGKYSDPAVDIS